MNSESFRIKIPCEDEFVAAIKEQDLVDLDKRDRKVLLAMSILEQRQLWVMETLAAVGNNLADEFEGLHKQMEQIQKEASEVKQLNWYAAVGKWIVIVVTAAILSGVAKKMIDKFIP